MAPIADSRGGTGVSDWVHRVSLTLLVTACVWPAVAAPATAGTYVEGVVGQPFRLHMLGEGMTIAGDEDQTLVLDLGAVTDGRATEAVCFVMSHADLGHIGGVVSFQRFRLHADFSQASGVSLTVFFDVPWEDKETAWQGALYTGTDETGALVYTPPPYSGGDYLSYKLRFTLAEGATGTVSVADFAVDWGEWVAPPDDDDDGGAKNDKDDRAGGREKQPCGVAYMGDSDGGSGSGGGGTGSGSGQGGGGSTGGGSQTDDGGASVDTDAPVTAEPVTSAGDTVTGYPLRVSDLIAGTTGGTDDSGSTGGPVPGDGQSGNMRVGLAWLVVPLLFLAPLAAAALDRRRALGRLRSLVESTPDEPAPATAAPA